MANHMGNHMGNMSHSIAPMSYSDERHHSDDHQRNVLKIEQTVVANILKRLFSDHMANSLFKSIYTDQVHAPLFSSDTPNTAFSVNMPNGTIGANSKLPSTRAEFVDPANAWCRFDVKNFCLNHFAKDPFPSFTVTMSQLNGDPLPRAIQDGKPVTMTDMRIKISVYNKWADVSSEVLPDTEFVRVLKDGCLTVSDLMFRDVSFKHGGYFIMHIIPLDFKGEIMSWKSPKFQIQSVKTHCVKKRKAAAASQPAMTKAARSPQMPAAQGVPVASDSASPQQKRPAFLNNASTLQESLNIFSNQSATDPVS